MLTAHLGNWDLVAGHLLGFGVNRITEAGYHQGEHILKNVCLVWDTLFHPNYNCKIEFMEKNQCKCPSQHMIFSFGLLVSIWISIYGLLK